MCRPGLSFANGVADGRKCLAEKICASPLARVAGPGIFPSGDQCPTLGPEGWFQPNVWCQCSKGD